MKTQIQTRIGLAVGLTLALLAGLAPRAEAAGYQMPITFTNDARLNTLSNFPALVIFDTNKVNYSQFLANGQDLRFMDGSGAELRYEVESWMSANSPSSNSCMWVQIPALTAGCVITAYWGNASATFPSYRTNGTVWADGYVGVWHLGQTNGVKDLRDFSTNRFDGGASTCVNTNGVIEGAQWFNGSSGTVNCGDINPTDGATSLTLEGWARRGSLLGGYGNIGRKDSVYVLRGDLNHKPIFFINNGSWQNSGSGSTSIDDGLWYHLAGVYDGTQIRVYVNGRLENSAARTGAQALANNGNAFHIGSTGGSGDWWHGGLDEVRLSTVARSSNWVWACYANMASSATFATCGAVIAPSSATTPPQIQNLASTGVATNGATFNGKLITNGTENAAVYVAWGQTNGAVSGVWATTNWWAAGAWTNGSYPSTNMALSANANYYYTFGATNSTTNVMASGRQYLITGEVTVQATDPTGRVTLADTAAFTVYRPANCTNEALTVAYTLGGTATNTTHYTNSPAATGTNGTVTIPAGQTNAVVTVYPMNLGAPEQTVALTLVSSNYPVGAANSATCTLVAAKTVYNDTAGGNWDSTSTWTPTGYPVSNDLAVVDSHTVTANVSLTNSMAPTSITVSTGGTVAHADAVVVASPVTMSGGTWAQSGNGGVAARRLTGPVTVTSGSLLTARRGVQGIWLDGPVSGAGRMTFRAVDGYSGEYQSVYLTAASNTHSGGMVVESNSLSLVAVTNQSLGTGDITVNADGYLWFRQTQDYTGAPRTPIVTLATTSSVVGFQSVDGMTLPFDLVVQGGGKVTAEANRTNEVWSGAVTLNTNLTLAARRNNNNGVGFALAGPVSGSGGIVVYADDVYWSGVTLFQGLVELCRGTNTYAGGTSVQYGRLKVSADGALGTGPVTVHNTLLHASSPLRTALQLDATPDMNWSLSNSIAGDGTIWVEGGTGSYRLTSSGTVSPGTNSGAVAVLTVDGQFAFAKNGGTPVTLAIDVASAGMTAGTDHDQLKVDHGDATLAASITNCALAVSLVPTPTALNAMTLTILVATNVDFSSYQFASVSGLGSGGSVVYSNGGIAVTWVAQTPVINNGSYANLEATSCDVSGTLSSTGDTPTEVRCYWGTNLVDKSGWGYTNFLGTQSVGTVTTSLTNLTGGVTYYYRFYATNGAGDYWSLATSNFTTLADVTWNDATNGNWAADNTNTWGAGLNQYPRFPLNDTVFIDSHTVTVTGAQPAVKATWVTRTAATTGTLYYADSSTQTRDLNLAGGILQLQGAEGLGGGGAKITNSVIRVSSNSAVYAFGGGILNDYDARIWSEICDATNGTGLLTAGGADYVRTRLYGANTNFTGGWRVSAGRGLHVHAEGALGTGTATVDTAIEVMVDHTNTATRPPPARVICNPGGGVYLNNAFPGYDVTVKDWEIELRGGALGFGVDGVGTYRGGHVYVVSNSTFYGRRDGRWGTDSRCEAEIVGTQRVTINANAGGIGTDDSQPMRFLLSGNNTNFSGGIDLRWNQLVAEQTNALGTGPILVASSDSGSGLYLDRPAGNFDWTLANDLSGGRGTNVAITVEDGAGANTLTLLGTLDPGTNGAAVTTNSTGILRVDGSVAFGTGSRLRIHIGGTNGVAGVDYDQLRVDHDLTGLSNAVLEVNVNANLAETSLLGQELVVVSNATALVGTFGSVQWNAPWSGRAVYNDSPGTVKLINICVEKGSVFRFR